MNHLFFTLLASLPFLTTALSAAEMALTEPLDYQIVQRNALNQGVVGIRGTLSGIDPTGARFETRLVSEDHTIPWQSWEAQVGKDGFQGSLTAPAGGWQRLEVRVSKNGQVLAGAGVDHLGIGEVFVVAGQSNSANHGEEKQSTQTGRVASFDGTSWQLANDPQPGASGRGGSFMPPLGDAMVRHFADIAAATELPILIYNVVPWTYLSPALLTRIIDEVPGVIGVKQSAGDMKLLADLLLLAGNRSRIMTAVDALLYPSFTLGSVGAIAAILTAAPTLCVDLWNAAQAGDHARGLALHEKLLPIWNAIFDHNLPANVRYCMELQGRRGGVPRPPMSVSSPSQQQKIYAAMEAAGLVKR